MPGQEGASRIEGPDCIEILELEPTKAKEALEVATGILKELGCQFWLDTGTLLGAVRDGGFIEGDFDIDLGLFLGEIKAAELKQALEEAGFQLVWAMQHEDFISPQLSMLYKDTRVDFACYERSETKGQVWHLSYVPRSAVALNVFPAYLFEKFEEVSLAGQVYPSPSPVGAFLRWRYGEWKIRQKDWNYMTDPPCVTKVCPWGEVDLRGYV